MSSSTYGSTFEQLKILSKCDGSVGSIKYGEKNKKRKQISLPPDAGYPPPNSQALPCIAQLLTLPHLDIDVLGFSRQVFVCL